MVDEHAERRRPRGAAGRGNLTGRAAVLAARASALLAISLAYPLREYLAPARRHRRLPRRQVAAAGAAGSPSCAGSTQQLERPGLRRGAGPGAAALRACRARRRTSSLEADEAPGRRTAPSRRRRRRPHAARGTPTCGAASRSRAATRSRRSRDRPTRDLDAVGGPARPRRRAACARSRTAARAATRTWSRPRRGCPTARPFPTLYYLTCPRAAVGDRHARGAG